MHSWCSFCEAAPLPAAVMNLESCCIVLADTRVCCKCNGLGNTDTANRMPYGTGNLSNRRSCMLCCIRVVAAVAACNDVWNGTNAGSHATFTHRSPERLTLQAYICSSIRERSQSCERRKPGCSTQFCPVQLACSLHHLQKFSHEVCLHRTYL